MSDASVFSTRTVRLCLALPLLWLSSACSLGYILKAGWYQANLLYGAEKIDIVLEESQGTAEQREKLRLVQELRAFAKDVLFLEPGKNYTTVNLEWNTLLHNVSASKPLMFEPYLWCFPITGCVPYKGYFVKEDAEAEFALLKEQNFDVAMRLVGGYSTLGYFQDPIWPSMLERSEGDLSDLIIHELAHRTVYFNSQSQFNESFANFVGKKGARLFLAQRFGAHSQQLREYTDSEHDSKIYTKYMFELYHALDEIYRSSQSDEEKRVKKEKMIKTALDRFSSLPFRNAAYKMRAPKSLNNANLIMFKTYHSNQGDFAQLFCDLGENWQVFITKMKELKSHEDPLHTLQQWVKQNSSQKACAS